MLVMATVAVVGLPTAWFPAFVNAILCIVVFWLGGGMTRYRCRFSPVTKTAFRYDILSYTSLEGWSKGGVEE